jgi:hypothetical protein
MVSQTPFPGDIGELGEVVVASSKVYKYLY